MTRFTTKRQKRESALRRRIRNKSALWEAFLILQHTHFVFKNVAGEVRYLDLESRERAMNDSPECRNKAIRIWLDTPEDAPAFAKSLDSFLGLPTESERQKYDDHSATTRNTVYAWVAILTLVGSVIAIIVSLTKCNGCP